MFKVGSKLVIGLAALAALNLIAYLVLVERLALGGVGLSMLFAALVGLAIVVRVINEGDDETQPRDLALTRPTLWPLVTVLGLVMLVLGLVVSQVYFVLGIVVGLAGLAEWLVQSWSETASDDASHNETARQRLLHPIEFPVIATLGVGVIIFAFSRIMLALSKSGGTIVFIVVSSIVLAVGAFFALRPSLKPALVGAICVIGALGLVAAGIAGAGVGLREDLVKAAEEGHFLHRECGAEKSKYFDKKPMKTLSLRSNVTAVIELRDGRLQAIVDGFDGPQDKVYVARANPVTFIFRNYDALERRLVADLGSAMPAMGSPTDSASGSSDGGKASHGANETCTQLIPQDAEQGLTVTYNKPSIAQESPLTLRVPGVTGQSIEVVVP